MMRLQGLKAEDFDEQGLLKVPPLFWCGLLLQARAWWLTGLAMATEHGGPWITFFYPDIRLQAAGLIAGVPALAMLFCYPVRGQLPGLARVVWLLMLLAPVLMAVAGGLALYRLPVPTAPGLVSLCADLACLVAVWPDRRLREVFFRTTVVAP
ncbi:DUF2919 domain-containing protein [Salmonella enterica subsp. enterica serovar Ball]|nr:DUF2919 domain-containing protein [Salmonella enterica subsp. enterica serovar Minnesota]ECI4647543.1 DUF2919 domain-containing protein [Salmonella enterica subsp. salamae]EDV5024272.1 DUF2919 domain-containing protein [Salmonella enterica subsp. enterica serovar Ball]